MLIVYLLRHGETQYNADGNRYCGRTDIDLTPKGLVQAEETFALFKDVKFDAVYSSPLKRAKLTAQIATGAEVTTDARLNEIDFGNWEGKTKEQFIKDDPKSWQNWMDDPATALAGGNGESGQKVINRVNSFFNEMMIKHANQTIAVVAHNGINRLYMASKLGMPLKNYRRIVQENCSITMFSLDEEGSFTLEKLNAKLRL